MIRSSLAVRPEMRFVFVFLLLLFGACSGGGGDSDSLPDGDEDARADGDGTPGDGDLDQDEGHGERERPQPDIVEWTDDTYGEWQKVAFCSTGQLVVNEGFEDGEIGNDPAWIPDYKVDGNPGGEASGCVLPAVVDGSEERGKVLSGRPDDTGSTFPPARLSLSFPADVDAFSLWMRLPESEGRNLFWLHHGSDPTGARKPPVRLFHNAELPPEHEGVPQQIEFLDQADSRLTEALDLDAGWHRADLYHTGTNLWRLDVDGWTVAADISAQNVSGLDLTTLFIGGDGLLDDIRAGISCDPPPEGRACENSRECGADQYCGRDTLCHETRTAICRSMGGCREGTTCVAEMDEEDYLGDGGCTAECSRHADCRVEEICLPHSAEAGTCRLLCDAEGICPDGMACYEVQGMRGCLPENCKRNGGWTLATNGLLSCSCLEGFVEDPFTGRCEAAVSCQSDADCGMYEICAAGVCYVNRQITCQQDATCPNDTTCAGFVLDGRIAGIGQCRETCALDSDCRPYEACIPATPEDWACLQPCGEDSDCQDNMACLSGYDGAYCMPTICQPNGEWAWSEADQAFTCQCVNGARPDPVSGRCNL